MMRSRFSIVVVLAAGVAACTSAQMRLPDNLPVGSRTEVNGFTGWLTGKFDAGPYSGTYRRNSGKETFLGTFKESRAAAEFQVSGPEISSTIEGDCRMRERAIDTGLVEVLVEPMAYRCAFTAEGRPFPARFELQEAASDLRKPYERRGEIALGGEVVQIRSLHAIEGTKLPTMAPIGYLFEQAGRPVGAAQLNGKPVLILGQGVSAALVRTLTIATLALATLSDPANDVD